MTYNRKKRSLNSLLRFKILFFLPTKEKSETIIANKEKNTLLIFVSSIKAFFKLCIQFSHSEVRCYHLCQLKLLEQPLFLIYDLMK